MNEATLIEISRHALVVTLELVMPVLLVSLVVGVIVSLFQAVTQVQEMTLTFVPKIFAIILTLVLIGPWMLTTIVTFTSTMIAGAPAFIH